MAIKIGKFYITRNNPRELLRTIKKNQDIIDKAIEYIEYNNEELYVYNPDYDYEENIVPNYDRTTFREDLLEILKGVIDWSKYQNEIKEIKDCFEEIKKDKKLIKKLKEEE